MPPDMFASRCLSMALSLSSSSCRCCRRWVVLSRHLSRTVCLMVSHVRPTQPATANTAPTRARSPHAHAPAQQTPTTRPERAPPPTSHSLEEKLTPLIPMRLRTRIPRAYPLMNTNVATATSAAAEHTDAAKTVSCRECANVLQCNAAAHASACIDPFDSHCLWPLRRAMHPRKLSKTIKNYQ